MTLAQKLLEIDTMIHADGGIAFLKARAQLEEIERLAEDGEPLAQQFSKSLDDVYRFMMIVTR